MRLTWHSVWRISGRMDLIGVEFSKAERTVVRFEVEVVGR